MTDGANAPMVETLYRVRARLTRSESWNGGFGEYTDRRGRICAPKKAVSWNLIGAFKCETGSDRNDDHYAFARVLGFDLLRDLLLWQGNIGSAQGRHHRDVLARLDAAIEREAGR